MYKHFSLLSLAFILILSSACSSINSLQERELREWQAKNLEVKEKSPGLAAGLNVLPGIGDFYNGNIGYGIVNLLTWPYSILWAPVGGASGATERNYYSTKVHVEQLQAFKKKVKSDLEVAHMSGQISRQAFAIGLKKIDTMELSDFSKDMSYTEVVPFSLDTNRQPSNDSDS